MPSYDFETVDVFTTVRFGGNPLAVVLDARGLDTATMQLIAREFALSETSFVLPAQHPGHTAQVRIFTPSHELPFAGHPNVGTALVLAARAQPRPSAMVFEELAGLVPVRLDWAGPHPRAAIDAPVALELAEPVPPELVAACAGLAPGNILTGLHPPIIAGTGTFFVVAETTSEALARATPDLAAIQTAAARYEVRPLGFPLHLHAATPTGRRTRMFAPLSGIPEDPATGSANLVLAGLLLHHAGGDRLEVEIEQGVEMGRPSLLSATAWRSAGGIATAIAGSAVAVSRGTLTL